jgi:multicomponent Na+:H+ antiporter subunit E
MNLPFAVLYFLNLIREIILSSLHVARVILNPGRHPDPVLIEFDSGLSGTLPNVILANSITLTPGTYTVGLQGDHFTVHCLVPEFADGMGDSSFVRLLRRLHMEEGNK